MDIMKSEDNCEILACFFPEYLLLENISQLLIIIKNKEVFL